VAIEDDVMVFLSYSRLDGDRTAGLERRLREAGIRVWKDEHEVGVGNPFRAYITAAIRSADGLVLAVSGNSVRSGEVLSEVELAKELRKPILPVYLEAMEEMLPDRLRLVIAGLDRAELYKDFDSGVARLVDQLRRHHADRRRRQRPGTSFERLRTLGTDGVETLAAEQERELAAGKFDAETLVTLGQCYMYLQRHDEAVRMLRRAVSTDPTSPAAAYLLALAIIAGRRPRALNMRSAEEIGRLLQRAVRLDSGAAHFEYLAAIVKIDYYRGHGLLVPDPSIDELVARAQAKPLDRWELARIAESVDVEDSLWRQVGL